MKAWNASKPALEVPLGKTFGPPGGPQGPPEGPQEVQKGSLKMLMKYGMLGINFLSFWHWKWIQDQDSFKIFESDSHGVAYGGSWFKGPLGRSPQNTTI